MVLMVIGAMGMAEIAQVKTGVSAGGMQEHKPGDAEA